MTKTLTQEDIAQLVAPDFVCFGLSAVRLIPKVETKTVQLKPIRLFDISAWAFMKEAVALKTRASQ